MVIAEKPFEGVHFYSVEELGVILSGFASHWSEKAGFMFDDPQFAKNLAMISIGNAKAYQRARGMTRTPHTAEEITAALPLKPVPFWLGKLREFHRGLYFNLLGYDTRKPLTQEDIKTIGQEVHQATSFIWFADRDEHAGPAEPK